MLSGSKQSILYIFWIPSFQVFAFLIIHPQLARLISYKKTIVLAMVIINHTIKFNIFCFYSDGEWCYIIPQSVQDMQRALRSEVVLKFAILKIIYLHHITYNRSIELLRPKHITFRRHQVNLIRWVLHQHLIRFVGMVSHYNRLTW